MTARTHQARRKDPTTSTAEIVREYGPFDGATHVHGVTHDGAARLGSDGS